MARKRRNRGKRATSIGSYHGVVRSPLAGLRKVHPVVNYAPVFVPDRPIRSLVRPPSDYSVPSPRSGARGGFGVFTYSPDPHAHCRKRRARRRAIFAAGRAGVNGQSTHRMTAESFKKC